MPTSQGSAKMPPRSRGSYGSRTKLRTTDSNSNSNSHSNLRGDRARSGSPSEFYRHQISQKDTISNRVYDMNVFIHLGIEKFLDKQAVRDLIIEYDSDDIFVGGADMFYANFSDEMNQSETVNFSRTDRKEEKRRFLDVVERMNQRPE